MFPRLAAQTMPGSKAPTKAPSARGNPDPVGVGGRRNKASRGARRQQRRRQSGKILDLLALADGETKLPEERGANIGAASLGKTGPCWRWRTEKQGVSGSKAPTKAPSARENLAPVGVGGRRNKASRGARRQHRRRQPEKILGMLAWADGETRRCREQSANMPCRATLIHVAFRKAEEIDDEPLFAEASSSISSRPPGELE